MYVYERERERDLCVGLYCNVRGIPPMDVGTVKLTNPDVRVCSVFLANKVTVKFHLRTDHECPEVE